MSDSKTAAEDLARLHETTMRVARTEDRPAALRDVLASAVAAVGGRRGMLSLRDGKEGAGEVTQIGFEADVFERATSGEWKKSVWATVNETGARVVVEEGTADGLGASHGVPLTGRTGEIVGGLTVHFPDCHVPGEREKRLLDLYAQMAADAVARGRTNEGDAASVKIESRGTEAGPDVAVLKRMEAVLRQTEAQLRLVTDNAMVHLAQCDREHRLKFVNRPYAQRFGCEPHELVGKQIAEVAGPTAYAAIRPHLEAALQGQRVEFELEIPYERFGKRWVRVVHEPERNADGEVVGLVAAIADITSRKHAEQEMETARDKALAASRAKDDFLAALSHELRTPLNPVLLLASEAAANPALSEDVRADFATIRKNVELEARLIDDLLDLTRITRGKMSLNLGAQDVHTILQDTIATMRPELEQKDLTIAFELKAHQPFVWGDAVRLQQVLWNVLKNAVKFTAEGGRVTVRTATDAAHERLSIEVSDTGIGMTPAERARVFDAFSQGDHAAPGGSHRFGGVGLGLAITRMLVELHRGTIEAASEGPAKGASFTVTLPLMSAEERAEQSAAPARQATRIPFNGLAAAAARRKILVVEDHEPTRVALASLLRRRQYDVATAESVDEARTFAAKGGIDLLISDIGLPDGNGFELMAELGERYKLKGIALTGYGMDHDVVRSHAAGFVAHLTKPVTIQSLDKALMKAMAGVEE